MKNFSKTILFIVLVNTSCATYRSALINDPKQVSSIWKNYMHEIDNKKIEDIVKRDSLNFFTEKPSSDSAIYYISDNDEILAAIFYSKETLEYPFEQRFRDMRAEHNTFEFGDKLLSLDSYQSKKDWIYCIEYTERKRPDKYRYFFLEASINGRFVKGNILTNPAHREKAIKLVDKFTKSLINITLDLSTKVLYLSNIWSKDMYLTDKKRIEKLVKIDNLDDTYVSYSCDSAICYTSYGDSIIACTVSLGYRIHIPFDERFEEMKESVKDIADGYQLLSSAGTKIGNNWIYVIESVSKKNPDKFHYFFVETSLKGRIVRGQIITDPAYRAESIKLINKFTKSLMNVTLDLKPNN